MESDLKTFMEKKKKHIEDLCGKIKAENFATYGYPDLESLLHEVCEVIDVPIDRQGSFCDWIGSLWFTLFRLRAAFFLMCAFAVSLAFFAGFLMEVFYCIFNVHVNFIWYLFLPFCMIGLALLGDEMCDLILDSLDFPPLHTFQAMLVTASVGARCHPCLWCYDVFTFSVFEGVPIVVGLSAAVWIHIDAGCLKMFCMGYVQGNLCSAILCTVFFVLADMIVAYRTKSNYHVRQVYMMLKHHIDTHKVNPYSLHCMKMEVDNLDEAEGGDEDERKSSVVHPVAPSAKRRWWTVLSIVASILMGFVWVVVVIYFTLFDSTTNPHEPWWVGTVLVLTVIACSWCLHRICPKLYGAPYILILAFFVFVGAGLNYAAAQKGQNPEGERLPAMMVVPPEEVFTSDLPKLWQGLPQLCSNRANRSRSCPQPYPVCGMAWGSPHAPVRALDLASLAWIVYEAHEDQHESQENIAKLLNRSFEPERRAKLVSVNKYTSLPRWGHFYFPPAGNATGSGGTRVIAVKGTSTTQDALFDTNLFSTVQVLQFLQNMLPVVTILPRLLLEWLFHHVHLSEARAAEEDIFKTLEGNIKHLMNKYPDDTFLLTGHSLGGGLSQIAGARLNLTAVVWSAPGAVWSSTRFGIEVQALKRSVISVMPDHDVVPRVDLQAGFLQLIECRKRDGEEYNALKCHSLMKTACEIWRVCGDKRDFRRQCSQFVKKEDLGDWYAEDDSTSGNV